MLGIYENDVLTASIYATDYGYNVVDASGGGSYILSFGKNYGFYMGTGSIENKNHYGFRVEKYGIAASCDSDLSDSSISFSIANGIAISIDKINGIIITDGNNTLLGNGSGLYYNGKKVLTEE